MIIAITLSICILFEYKAKERIQDITAEIIITYIVGNYLHNFCISKFMCWRDNITIDLEKRTQRWQISQSVHKYQSYFSPLFICRKYISSWKVLHSSRKRKKKGFTLFLKKKKKQKIGFL